MTDNEHAPTDSGRTLSLWMTASEDTARQAQRTQLPSNVEADVCVVGAGIAGLTTAYLLACEGRSVVLLDDGPIGGGETGRTTAHLTHALDDRYGRLEQLHGQDGARLAAESHTAAIVEIERIVKAEGIDCAFERVDGYLVEPVGEASNALTSELAAAHRAGLIGVELIDRVPYDGFEFGPALHFPRQAQIHALDYLYELARAFERKGGRLYTGTHVDSVDSAKGSARVETTNGCVVRAAHVVVATNTPFNDRVVIHTKQAPYRTYVVAGQIPVGSVPHILLWDTPDPYHYVRVHHSDEGDYLIVGGEDHKTGQANDAGDRFKKLEDWARERFPMVTDFDLRWSGQVLEPIDGLAFIGRNPADADNVFIATGDSGNGMTHGTIAGLLLTDLIMGRENPWADLYRPSRKTLSAAGEFVKETANVVLQYADHLHSADVASVDDVPSGCGAVVQEGSHKVAVFRADDGTVSKFSAVCPHLGCIVRWNGLERSWDCPCHGSRFDKLGGIIHGPAIKGLETA